MRDDNLTLTTPKGPETVSMKSLSVVVLGNTEERRRHLREALTGTQALVRRDGPLPDLDELAGWVSGGCDVLLVDLDRDAESALDVVEAACTNHSSLTVMVCSRQADSELLLRSMRAGAREFLTDPLSSNAVAEALVRASMRRDELARQKKTVGKLLLFVGAKGGSGVTTIAANFAVLLAKESGGKVTLLDLDLQLGDSALNLGIRNEFSTADALRSEQRLDADLVSTMLVEHSSGLRVLAAADAPQTFQPSAAGVAKLAAVLRGENSYVVVDAGSDYPAHLTELFEAADKLYLVTQVSVVELRNCHRIINAHFAGETHSKLEVILNRYQVRAGEIDEASIVKALTVTPAWKVPSDFGAARRAQNSATALALKDGPITRALADMAKTACGKNAPDTRKKKFGLF